jgi:hypothetical protein
LVVLAQANRVPVAGEEGWFGDRLRLLTVQRQGHWPAHRGIGEYELGADGYPLARIAHVGAAVLALG